MKSWAARVPRDSASALRKLRVLPHIKACLAGEWLWLRGPDLSEELERQLRTLPGAERYELDKDELLVPRGARLPSARLPQGDWQPLRGLLPPELVCASAPQAAIPQLPVSLVRDGRERPIAALQTTLGAWRAYADSAPLVRLAGLAFLANRHGQVLLMGAPLPPLAGPRYWESEGLYVAAGYTWQPAVDATIVRRVLGLDEDELVIWQEDGTWQRANRTHLIKAARSSVRATAEERAHGID